MNCPNCHKPGTDKVIDSRDWRNPQLDQTGIRRRRECKLCHTRFTTVEIIAILAPDGSVIPPELNGHTNGHKPAPKPKAQKAVTRSQRDIKKQLDQALRRARINAVKIEDEDLLNDPDLMDDLDASDIDDFEDFDL